MIVLPETEMDGATSSQNSEKVKEHSFVFQGEKIPVTISIGCALVADNDTANELIQRRREALRSETRRQKPRLLLGLRASSARGRSGALDAVECVVRCPTPRSSEERVAPARVYSAGPESRSWLVRAAGAGAPMGPQAVAAMLGVQSDAPSGTSCATGKGRRWSTSTRTGHVDLPPGSGAASRSWPSERPPRSGSRVRRLLLALGDVHPRMRRSLTERLAALHPEKAASSSDNRGRRRDGGTEDGGPRDGQIRRRRVPWRLRARTLTSLRAACAKVTARRFRAAQPARDLRRLPQATTLLRRVRSSKRGHPRFGRRRAVLVEPHPRTQASSFATGFLESLPCSRAAGALLVADEI